MISCSDCVPVFASFLEKKCYIQTGKQKLTCFFLRTTYNEQIDTKKRVVGCVAAVAAADATTSAEYYRVHVTTDVIGSGTDT